MIIMILGELCNFGAYAFVEAIIVVSPTPNSVCLRAKPHMWLSDPYGRSLCGHIVHTVALFAQGEAIPIRMDIVYTVPAWSVHPRPERTRRAKRFYH